MKKTELLLIIKEDIEKMVETNKYPLATRLAIMEGFHGFLANKGFETIMGDVKGFYEKYNFVNIKEKGIGWFISFIDPVEKLDKEPLFQISSNGVAYTQLSLLGD